MSFNLQSTNFDSRKTPVQIKVTSQVNINNNNNNSNNNNNKTNGKANSSSNKNADSKHFKNSNSNEGDGNDSQKLVEHLRCLVTEYLEINCNETALFWADKINELQQANNNSNSTSSKNNNSTTTTTAATATTTIKDLYVFIDCLVRCGQYKRALNCIKQRDLHIRNLTFRYVAAKCHVAAKEYEQALELLNWEELNAGNMAMGIDGGGSGSSRSAFFGGGKFHAHTQEEAEVVESFTINGRNINSAISLLRGQIHEQLGCSDAAIECYKAALDADVFCVEAFRALSANQMLTPSDENVLVEQLPVDAQCSQTLALAKEAQLVKYVYATKLSRPSKQNSAYETGPSVQWCVQELKENLDILINKANRLYYDGDFESSYALCRQVLDKDPFEKSCVPLYVSTLVHLNKVTQLFEIAHSLVKQYPQDTVSWFAVGCYYFLIGNMDPARKFFLKATCLNRSFSPAWLALGHSFAQESEHDQATSAYFTAAQIMKGSFLPFLYIGLEYTLSNNLKLAERFYQQALNVECDDPFVLHELGVIWFKSQNYQNAEISMRRAYARLKSTTATTTTSNTNSTNSASHKSRLFKEWEPLLNNLGHVCRKLKKYDDSLEFHRKALALYPTNSSTWTSIGMTSIFLNKFDEAIEYFHQALWYKKTDLVAKKLLDKCLSLFKEHSSLTLSDGFELNMTEIMLAKKAQQAHQQQEQEALHLKASIVDQDDQFMLDANNHPIKPVSIFQTGAGDSSTSNNNSNNVMTTEESESVVMLG